jgi:hypothetical protein
MISKNPGRRYLCLSLVTLALASASAAAKGPTGAGTYTNWNREVDEVTIVQPFRLDAYNDIAVESFDTSHVALPNPKDNTYEAVRSALTTIKSEFIQGFQKKLRQKPGVRASRGQGKGLVIRLQVTELDPGSQAARYWAGFGAGAVRIAVTGEVIDATSTSPKTLIRFKQERRSGFGLLGGGYAALFGRTARQIGGDVAGLLNAF